MTQDNKKNNSEFDIWISEDVESVTEVKEQSSLTSLRPNAFSEYVGQGRVKDSLLMACGAAKHRSEPLDHILLYGPPGLGKTSLAKIISREMGVGFKGTSGPVIERPGDLAAMLTSLEANDILFIDEIHRLPRIIEEVLYPAMEDYEIDILIGQGPAAKSVKIPLKPFTLIGATTRSGLLTSPLRDRFGIVSRLEYYSAEELSEIVQRSARLLEVEIEQKASLEIGRRARGTPRIANRLLKRARDFSDQNKLDNISLTSVNSSLELLDIDHLGLSGMDRQLLRIIIEKFNGGPVGVETIAAALGEEKDTIEDVYEPFLIQNGLLARTRRGREVTEQAYKHLNIPITNKSAQQNLNLLK